MPLWPRLDLNGVAREASPAAAPKPEPSEVHEWLWLGTFWRCQRCLKFKRQEDKPPDKGCSGNLPPVALTFAERGHKCIGLLCDNATVLYLCTRCFGYTSGGQFKKLRGQCIPEPDGKPSKSAAAVLKSLRQGLHPKLPGVTCEVFRPDVAE